MDWLQLLLRFSLEDRVSGLVWFSPAFEYLHFVGHTLLFGAILFFDLRLLGIGRSIAISDLSHLTLRWAATGFGIAVISGVTLFLANLQEFWGNPMLVIKLLVICLALVNIAFFHFGFGGRLQDGYHPGLARICGLVSLSAWIVVIAAGRLIAYF